MKQKLYFLSMLTIILLIIVSTAGILSLDFSKSYDVINQYGDTVRIYGYGIYSHDSFFKAPILIGTDYTILIIAVPLFIITFLQNIKNFSQKSELKLLSLYSVALYYSASLSFGVAYNRLHLIYVALFSCSLFGIFHQIRKIDISKFRKGTTRGLNIFLILTGVALIAAWMPDIIPTVISGESLNLIEVYTTEITYVLDMGIIGPLCLICLYLLKKKDGLGTILLASILKLCIFVGFMMVSQALCQIASGYETTVPVLVTKTGSFVLLAIFALYFNQKLYKET
ncbi:MAG: hypothetical protein A2Y15_05205 [Clostridiales bacterium GWF2_36_10]|nr:MAG: hypothetical protein A2Y15_05205 [Clostridiales bacterium GWF2_36_10]HAN20062.1 hypothetical protein [Clostridiales bacterium]